MMLKGPARSIDVVRIKKDARDFFAGFADGFYGVLKGCSGSL